MNCKFSLQPVAHSRPITNPVLFDSHIVLKFYNGRGFRMY